MNTGGLILVIGSILSAAGAFVWLAMRLGQGGAPKGKGQGGSIEDAAKTDVEHIFNEDFREELRNRGRLHFEACGN